MSEKLTLTVDPSRADPTEREPMMRTIQEIFNVVIDGGFYSNEFVDGKSSGAMCEALTYAHVRKRITAVEAQQTQAVIQEYLNGYIFLRTALSCNALPCGCEDRLAIYRNWAERPQIKGFNHAG